MLLKTGLLRNFAVYMLKNYDFILFFYNTWFRIKNRRKFNTTIAERAHLAIFDYKELAKPLPFYPRETVKDSNYYGYFHALRQYMGIDKRLPYAIEHGLYLGSFVPKATFFRTTKSIITFSANRERHLKNAGVKKRVVTIGPYIHYAANYYNETEYNALKKELGKTLLVFPSHSFLNTSVNLDIEEFINCIQEKAVGFDSVLVCLYYKDILNDTFCKRYEDAGFRIVTAGNFYDLNFVSRLKSIISLADFMMSNATGTHIGYCIYMNKPHYIFRQKIERTFDKSGKIIENSTFRNKEQCLTLEEEKAELFDAFSEICDEITPKQRDVINKYWGVSSIRTKEELIQLLK